MKHAGLIGYPVAHSLSPAMQQAAFDALGIAARYVLWETQPASLAQSIAALRSPDILGANITIPYKQDVMPLVDECDPLAASIGAINTIVNHGGRLLGYNTDAHGFMQALTAYAGYPITDHPRKVVILGTGGAARAAAVALLQNGVAQVALLGRTEAHLQSLLHHLRTLAETCRIHPHSTIVQGALLGNPAANTLLSSAELVVNATSVGLKAGDTTMLFDVHMLPTSALVMDLIFNPPLTPLLCATQAHGCRILNGLPMLLYQGALAFELWVGCPAPLEQMCAAIGLSMTKGV